MPYRPAVYRLFDSNDVLLYVGCTGSFGSRLGAHARRQPWWQHVTMVLVEHFDDIERALEAEATAIHVEKPLYNQKVPDPLIFGELPELGIVDSSLPVVPTGRQPAPALMTVAEAAKEFFGGAENQVRIAIREGWLVTYRERRGRWIDAESAAYLRRILSIRDVNLREDALNGLKVRIYRERREAAARSVVAS